MNVCLRSGVTRYLGHKLWVYQEFHVSLLSRVCNSGLRSSRPSTRGIRSGTLRHVRRGHRSRQIPCPVPVGLRGDPVEWICFLEQYLPPRLRKNLSDDATAKGSEPEQCQAILQLLYQARTLMNFDLLAYLGIRLDRWDAVHEIVKKLLDNAERLWSSPLRGCLPSNLDWASLGSFSTFTQGELKLEEPVPLLPTVGHPSLGAFDVYSEEPIMTNRMGESVVRVGTMEELWQSLGSIVLEAADLPSKESQIAMSYFYQILAHLHHINFIPHDVYKYTPMNDSEGVNRPPGLYHLSSQIMSILSDAVWSASEAEIAAEAAVSGAKVPTMRFKMRVRELSFEVWLEFVLWCCVDGGFAREGAWILERMRGRLGEKTWFVKSWATLLQGSVGINTSKINRYDTWEKCANAFVEDITEQSWGPFLGLGKRTVSREVVISLMDGLINSIRVGVGYRGDSSPHVLERIGLLRSILDKNELYLSPGELNALLVRMLEAGGIVPEIEPQSLELLLDLAPHVVPGEHVDASFEHLLTVMSQDYILNNSAIVSGLYQYTLDTYSAKGHVSGALDVFEKLLAAVDSTKVLTIHQFSRELKYHIRTQISKKSGESRNVLVNLESGNLEWNVSSLPQLSSLSLALLLDVSIASRAYCFAEWLLFSTDADGPVITPSSYGDRLLAPPIIRFAEATKNHHLLAAVSRHLIIPLPTLVLKAILNYRITDYDWENVISLLAYLRDRKHSHWGVSTATSLAAAILRLDQPYSYTAKYFSSPESQTSSLERGKEILAKLLKGEFSRKPDPAEARYHYQEETLSQLCQIFESIPGALSEVCGKVKEQWDSSRIALRTIPSFAFHHLLAAVVETQGSIAGKRLWDRWCIDPWSPQAQRIQPGGTSRLYFSNMLDRRVGGVVPHFDPEWNENKIGKLVVPDLRTVRIIAQGALKEVKGLWKGCSCQGEDIARRGVEEILDWSIESFEKFRLSRREIDRELDGYLTRIRDEARTT